MHKSTIGLKIKFLDGKFIFWIVFFGLLLLFFCTFSDICFPFVVGFAIAYLCSPFVNFASKYVNRTLLSGVLSVGSICIFIVAGLELFPRLKEYLIFLTKNIPSYYDCFISFLDSAFSSVDFIQYKSEITSIKLEIQKYLDQKVYIFASIIGEIASKRGIITNFFSFLVIMPISLFYFLRDWNSMEDYLYSCIPNRQKSTVLEASRIVRKTFVNFFRGQFYVVAILSIYYALLLTLIDLATCIYWGILSGIFSFVPFIGALFSCLLVLFINVPTLTLAKLHIILVIYAVGQFIEGYILYPKFVGQRTGLHPLWILFSFFAGIKLGGIGGVLAAIPLAAVIRSLIKFAVGKFRASQTYKQ
ncbi:MAG: AI-2E family transporter [Holosporaceae bacterium]|jgi:predicted PurR-regulated permease PerM|nr:AI-2E family transporter [Holosporaceae bacterium]